MTKKKILLIHSGPTEGNGTRRHLEESGYLVVPAGAGLTDLNLVKSCCFDLILLDVIFPDTEGLDLCRRFRERHETRSIPIILIIGRGYSPDYSLPKSSGPDAYLVRPFTYEELDEKVSAVLHLNTAETSPRAAPAYEGRSGKIFEGGIKTRNGGGKPAQSPAVSDTTVSGDRRRDHRSRDRTVRSVPI